MYLSVVIATYNGEDYIYEQMQSIYEQTRRPDEVIICDDCSKDKTVTLIQDFIRKYDLKKWKLEVNSENKGWQHNFIEALGKTTGDCIFFSDQDDIWYRDKIEIMMNFMEKYPEIQCLSGKVTTIDEKGNVFYGKNEFSSGNNSERLIHHIFSTRFNTLTLLGCTMCITRKIAEIVIQMNVGNYGHDAQCCRLGALLDGAYTLDKPVIYYRLHSHNTSGVVSGINIGSSNLQKRINDISQNIIWLKRLLDISKSKKFLDEEKEIIIMNTIKFQKERYKFFSNKSIFQFIKLLKYRKYYSGISMYIGDFTYAFHINKLAGKILYQLRKIKR